MRATQLCILAAAAAAVIVSSGEARADHPLADPHVREIESTLQYGKIYRGVVTKPGRRASLVVEVLAPGDRGQPLRYQERVGTYWENGRRYPLRARDISLRRFRDLTLRFVVTEPSGRSLRCTYDLEDRRARAECRSRRARPGPHPRPRPGPPHRPPREDWSEVERVRQACAGATTGRRQRAECLDVVQAARFEPTRMIRACDRAVTGSRSALQCLELGAGARRDPSRAIARCDREERGSRDTLRCVERSVSRRRR